MRAPIHHYTEADLQYCIDHYQKDQTPAQCARKLGCGASSLRKQVTKWRGQGHEIAYGNLHQYGERGSYTTSGPKLPPARPAKQNPSRARKVDHDENPEVVKIKSTAGLRSVRVDRKTVVFARPDETDAEVIGRWQARRSAA